jgi:hypothetical protein
VRPNLYQRATRYVYQNAMVTGMDSTSNQLRLQVYVSDIGDLSRTFLYLHNSPDFVPNGVQLGSVPEFRQRIRRVQNPYDLPDLGSLYQVGGGNGMQISMPGNEGTYAGGMPPGDIPAGGSPYGSGGMGPAAGRMGSGGPMGGAAPMMPMGGAAAGSGGPMSMGPMSASGAAGAGMSGGPMSAGAGAMPGMGGSGGGGGGNNNGEFMPPGIDPSRLPPGATPVGSVVVITCTLKNPINRPAIGGDTGGNQGGGGGMPFGSGGGGSPFGSGGMGPSAGGTGGMSGGGMSGGGMSGGGRRGAASVD